MFQKLISQADNLITFSFFALLFGLIKAALSANRSVKSIFLTIFVTVPVGTLVGALSLEVGFGEYASLTITSVCSLLAQDIVLGVINNREFLSGLFKRAAENIVDKTTK